MISSFLSGCASSLRNYFTFFPDTQSEILKENMQPYISENLLQTADGETIQSFYFKHDEVEPKQLLIYFHGNAGNLYHRFGYAQKLYEMNYDILLVSYRGYAKSSGKPNEPGIYLDAKTAIDFATDSLKFQEKNIVLYGRSLGSAVAVHSAQNRKFKGVVLATPMTSGREMSKAMGMGYLKSVAGNSFNSIEKITNLASPLLIVHGDLDDTIPIEMGQELYETYQGTKCFTEIKGGNHNDLQDVSPEQFWGDIEKFLGSLK